MASDDRERNFEKAMARELRSDALNGLHCPDAETLAAYYERLLSPEEMATHKSHIASCERCQEILSTLEITETISAESDRAEAAVAARGPKALSPLDATPVFSKVAAAASGSTPKVREMPKPKPYLHWAVPAGAIAAGLLVWVAIDHSWNQRKAAMKATTQIEVAENREQKEPQLAAPKTAEAPAPSVSQPIAKGDLDDKSKLGREYDGAVSDGLGAGQGKLQTRSAMNLPHGPRVVQNQAQNQIQNNANNIGSYTRQNEASDSAAVGGALAKAVPSAPTVDALGRGEGALKAAPAPPPSAPASADAGARKGAAVASATEQVEVTSAAPMESKSATKKEMADDEVASEQNFGLVSDMKIPEAARRRDKDALGETIVWSPDPQVFWVIQKNGTLTKSENGGKSAAKQKLGSGVQAIAGSAVDAKTCWVLAEGGLVFRTEDGGKHWFKAATPVGLQFRSVVASDAMHAVIVDASGQVKYATSDGGATWGLAEPK